MSPRQQSPFEPTKEDLEWYSKQSMYVGFHKPEIQRVEEPIDKYAWKRQEVANRLGVHNKDLADEPDNDAGSPEQAWA